VELSYTLFWNTILTLVVAPLILVIRGQIAELRRMDILLNKTREELGRDYVSKMELDSLMNRIMNAIDRLHNECNR